MVRVEISHRHFCVLMLLLLICSGCAPTVIWQGRSPDHTHYAEIKVSESQQYVELDGVKGPTFQGIADFGILFSPEGGHLAYPALQDERWIMVRDGLPGPAWDGISDPVFSPDGRHLAYAAQLESSWYVVNDNLISSPFDSLLTGSLLFSPNSERLVFAAWVGSTVHLIEADTQGPAFVGINDIQFSTDSSKLAYLGCRDKTTCLVVDGKPRLCGQALKNVAVSFDGSRVAVAVRDSVEWKVQEEKFSGSTYSKIESLKFEPEGNQLVYVGSSSDGQQLVVNGIPGPVWAKIEEPVFSAHGGRLGYIATKADSQLVVVDGQAIGRHFWASDLVFRHDGRELAYLAGHDGGSVIIHGDVSPVFPLIIGGSLDFSSDGLHLGCLAGDPDEKKLFLVVDGQPTNRLFSWGEYTSALARDARKYARGKSSSHFLRAWVRAEMDIFLQDRK